MIHSPATLLQYETVHEPEDGLDAPDELALSGTYHPSRRKAPVAQEAASKRQDKPALAHPPIPKTITPVPLPRTAPVSHGTSSPEQRVGTPPSVAKSGGKGRPKGWRPGMSYADVRNFGPEVAAQNAGLDPSRVRERVRKQRTAAPLPGTQAIRKRRGRPPREPSPSPLAIYETLGPQFVPFLCEWSGCKAELHNLETLERHVLIVHCRRKPALCLWAKCAEGAVRFKNRRGLEKHVKMEHLVPLAWHVGDGPKVSLPRVLPPGDEEELPRYLFDEEGRQVTPSVRDQAVEDHAGWRARKQMLKAFLKDAWDTMPFEGESGEEEVVKVPALGVTVDG